MTRTQRMPPEVGLDLYINIPVEDWQRVYKANRIEQWERALGRMRNVDEVCLDHQCWIRLSVSARTYEGLAREVEGARERLAKLTKRYATR